MTWTKLSDDFSDDCWQLSDAAWRLHVEGLLWSNRKLLDLRLSKDEMRLWAKHPAAAEELVAVGWWRDEGEHYVIVHHALYQRTREVALKLQERNQRNGARGGRPPKIPRERFAPHETQVGTQMETDVETQRVGSGRVRTGLDNETTHESPNGVQASGIEAW
ncbi:MAG TPA: hypothetical protein VGG53_00025 [Mycobacterium sp.]|jgi:hypothetical protein|uniref:hypothetical protein n=1 Tax=Mycobacterium sp. TaxID=1785 RepID=UPI002F3E5A07